MVTDADCSAVRCVELVQRSVKVVAAVSPATLSVPAVFFVPLQTPAGFDEAVHDAAF
jgi:hypothetical protein